MAAVQLADVYVPVPFNAGVDAAAIELNAFMASGVLGTNPIISAAANGAGSTGEIPFFNPLDVSAEPNYSDDNPAAFSVPDKIGGGKQIYRKNFSNKSWSTMDLANELALKDPMAAIVGKVGQYWATQSEKRVLSTALGILADNIDNDGKDMLYDISNDLVAAVTDAERISAEAILGAKATMGDHAGKLQVLAVHSILYTKLQSQNLIIYIPNSRGEINIPTYLGYRVVQDDSMPVEVGVNRLIYTSILFATGAVSYATGQPDMPSELERIPSGGTGGGQSVIHTRKTELIHPQGLQVVGVPAGASLTLAELEAAATWDRVLVRKNIGIAFLKTNG